MKLLRDAAGHVVVRNEKPVYVTDDGKEIEFDADHTVAKIGQLNAEAQNHRQAAEGLNARIKTFEGIDDPVAARKALDVVRNLDDKKLVDAGQVEKVKTEAIAAVELRYKPIVEERDKLKSDFFDEKVGGAFARSKFITEKSAIPADFVQARFGSRFKLDESGRIIGHDANGKPIYSHTKPGEIAEFDEALEIIVSDYPDKAKILKGTGAQGGGAHGTPNGAGGKATISRAEFDKLPLTEKAVKGQEAAKGTLTITDS